MDALEMLARLTLSTSRNLAHNLEFLPDERLDWRPEPAAKSALEVVYHAAGNLRQMQAALADKAWEDPALPRPENRLEAQSLILTAAEGYAAALRSIPEADHTRVISLPWGARLLPSVADMPVVDLIYHYGQVAYLQTLLGDGADHYDATRA